MKETLPGNQLDPAHPFPNLPEGTGVIETVAPRKSAFIRLAPTARGEYQQVLLANADQMLLVFACSNPVPEIWPWEAQEAGARIVGTGRSDFGNQLNNSLGFPAIFRGALDVRARTITDEMCLAAAA